LKNSSMRPTVASVLVGIPRYYSSILPRLLATLRMNPEDLVGAFFWRYPGKDIPQTSQGHYPSPITDAEWESLLKTSNFDASEILPPITLPSESHLKIEHTLTAKLGLKPNPVATLSWLTALAHGAKLLGDLDPNHQRDFWVIARPDLRVNKRSLSIVLKRLASDNSFLVNSVAIASRRKPHTVLELVDEKVNLPVDHFFIGRPETIAKFMELPTFVHASVTGMDTRQPVVNEFLIGQFFKDNEMQQFPVKFGYLVWRGSWLGSLSGFGRRGISLARSQLAAWMRYQSDSLFPGVQQRGH